jgi:hypothetical protein
MTTTHEELLETMEEVEDEDFIGPAVPPVVTAKKGKAPKVGKVVKAKTKAIAKVPRRRRPLKRTEIGKLQLRLIDYTKRLEINKTRVELLEKKLDSINHEMACREVDESIEAAVEEE